MKEVLLQGRVEVTRENFYIFVSIYLRDHWQRPMDIDGIGSCRITISGIGSKTFKDVRLVAIPDANPDKPLRIGVASWQALNDRAGFVQVICEKPEAREIVNGLALYLSDVFAGSLSPPVHDEPTEATPTPEAAQTQTTPRTGWRGSGKPPKTRKEKIQAIQTWDNTPKGDRPRQEDWLRDNFGEDPATGALLVPESTFQGWRKLKENS